MKRKTIKWIILDIFLVLTLGLAVGVGAKTNYDDYCKMNPTASTNYKETD